MLSEMQDAEPASAFVVTPGTNFVPETYRVADYGGVLSACGAVSRRALISGTVASDPYPEPIEHCEICRWRRHCDQRRRADDHMSLVAGISKSQIGELERRGVDTMAALAALPVAAAVEARPRSRQKLRKNTRAGEDPGRGSNERCGSLRDLAAGRRLRFVAPSRSHRRATFSSISRAIRSSVTADWSFCLVISTWMTEGSAQYVGDWASIGRRKGGVRTLRRLRDRAPKGRIPICTSTISRPTSRRQ